MADKGHSLDNSEKQRERFFLPFFRIDYKAVSSWTANRTMHNWTFGMADI